VPNTGRPTPNSCKVATVDRRYNLDKLCKLADACVDLTYDPPWDWNPRARVRLKLKLRWRTSLASSSQLLLLRRCWQRQRMAKKPKVGM